MKVFAFFALSLTAVPAQALPLRLPPVDQCVGDPSFVRFRSALIRTIARRDATALLKLVADDVTVDFDGSQGPRDFARVWKLSRSRPEQSPIWQELAAVMRLGCARIGSARVMPSLVGQLDGDVAFDKLVALPGAMLRSDRRAIPLNYHLVTMEEGDAPEASVRVRLEDGRGGIVRRDQLRSALQFRAQFEKRRGRWRMTSFVEGD